MSAAKGRRAGLGGAFSAPATTSHRGEGLGTILGPSRATTDPAALSAPSLGPATAPPAPAKPEEVSRSATSSTTTRAATGRRSSGSRKRNTPIYLTDAVQDALRNRARETGLSYAELAVEAFRSVRRIDELFVPLTAVAADEDEIPAAPVSAADRFPTGTNLVNIRFTDEQRAWLDKQWVAKGASSRSMFVATVLTVYLTGDRSET